MSDDVRHTPHKVDTPNLRATNQDQNPNLSIIVEEKEKEYHPIQLLISNLKSFNRILRYSIPVKISHNLIYLP